MSLKQLPKINAKNISGVKWDTPSDALSKWDASVISAQSGDNVIKIYEQIGSDGWSEGMTSKRIAGILRSIGSQDVTVSINSPGGDFFEGIAIYNILREHPHKVTVKVVGLAASAASVIAMAGDDIHIAKTAFLMIHNAWAFVIGNRHDMVDASDVLGEFDGAMSGLYADITGMSNKATAQMMDDETWISGQNAIDLGFANTLLSEDDISESNNDEGNTNAAVKKMDILLAKQGLPRSERRELIKQIKGTPNAARNVTPSADIEEANRLISKIKRQ